MKSEAIMEIAKHEIKSCLNSIQQRRGIPDYLVTGVLYQIICEKQNEIMRKCGADLMEAEMEETRLKEENEALKGDIEHGEH